MGEGEQDRSEQPTVFKLRRARRKGMVARGADLGFFAGLLAAAGFAWIGGTALVEAMARAMRLSFAAAAGMGSGHGDVMAVASANLTEGAQSLVLLAAAAFTSVLVFELVQTGFVFSTSALKPDFARLNPAKGLKRLFTVRMLVETAKNILKMIVYGGIGALVVLRALETDAAELGDAARLAAALGDAGFRLTGWFLLAALLFAALDQVVARRDFLKRMRMSRREMRRELRDQEGEPRLKQRRKQLHGEFARLSESLRNVRGADVLIVNPVHFAVALRYNPARSSAPVIVARGAHAVAARLKRLAFTYNVTVVEDCALAQLLYRLGALNREIPEGLYSPVAAIYRRLRRDVEPQPC